MKKIICCLVILISFTLSAPMGFGSPCTDECYDTYTACAEACWEYGLIVCAPYYFPACMASWGIYCYNTCELPLQDCLAECQ